MTFLNGQDLKGFYMYVLCFYVPEDCKEQVKKAIFASGAGRIGDYDHCCFEIKGRGQFRPLSGAKPTIGRQNQLEFVSEVKVEVVVAEESIRMVLRSLIDTHPYEEPAYHLFKSVDVEF